MLGPVAAGLLEQNSVVRRVPRGLDGRVGQGPGVGPVENPRSLVGNVVEDGIAFMGRGQDAHVVSGCVETVAGLYGPKPYRIVGIYPVLARRQRGRGTDQIELIGCTRPMSPQQRGRSGVIGMVMREQDCPHVAQRASEPLGCAWRLWPAVAASAGRRRERRSAHESLPSGGRPRTTRTCRTDLASRPHCPFREGPAPLALAPMVWTWRYEDGNGNPVDRPGAPREDFPTQADAESWLGESWRDLLANGVDQVTLLDGDRVVYAGMSLHPGRLSPEARPGTVPQSQGDRDRVHGRIGAVAPATIRDGASGSRSWRRRARPPGRGSRRCASAGRRPVSMPAAPALSTTCSGRLAPMMAAETLSFCSTHAVASWAMDRPASSATGCSRCTRVSTSSSVR